MKYVIMGIFALSGTITVASAIGSWFALIGTIIAVMIGGDYIWWLGLFAICTLIASISVPVTAKTFESIS